MRRVVAVVQARMGSTRLPGKVLLPLGGRPMLQVMLERLSFARTLDEVVVATTTSPADDAIVDLCSSLGMTSFRGSEADVLGRTRDAARAAGAGIVVRVTSDCPLIDPGIVDEFVSEFRKGLYDYLSTSTGAKSEVVLTYPHGLDVEVFTYAALDAAAHEAILDRDREHVTYFITDRPERFRVCRRSSAIDWSGLRVTVDYPDDLVFVRSVVDRLGLQSPPFGLAEVVRLLREHPELLELNRSRMPP